ncbi:cytochrome c [Rhodovulum imhoffii]|uniref:Cytochrome c n=1 Tax=Rhodovulum imhoffii TaxID=365340 RepID=A0A2T5BSM1_9RHOB|nr:cytochrome c family protein [Rhodovulum imhoffii]MBK5933433.1 hypothetical protein [Rhodovulum imhoffii]PTN02330.1 cytochrome c [Rhodovulum imhoffii]
MSDTLAFTKVFAALSGALLIFVVVNMAAKGLYRMPAPGEGAQAYVAPGGEEAEAAPAEPERTVEEILASGDADAGARVFKKCQACHKVDPGVNLTGPTLYQVVGRAVGVVEGFGYSGALDGTTEAWTPEALFAYLENPRGFAPGTTMTFAGLPKAQDRADVIAYLRSQAQ